MNVVITLIILIIMLSIIIFIHEFGHFIAAKKSGVYVDEFSLGMGPAIWKHKSKKDETTYVLRAFPMGGFVAMAEKENEELKIKKSQVLENKSVFKNVCVLLMGIIFNCVLAFLLFFLNGLLYGEPISSPYVGAIQENTPASKSGIKVGDKIESINGVKIYSWDDVLLEISAKELQDNYEFVITEKNGNSKTINMVPEIKKEDDVEKRVFGIGMAAGEHKERTFVNAIKYGFSGCLGTIKTIGRIIGNLFTGGVSVKSLSGPVGIYSIIDKVKSQGLETLIYLTAYLSINVGMINLLPFPVFDGGRLLFYLIEKITKKELSDKVESIVNYVGFGLLLLLMILITANDIVRLFN